MGGNKGSSDGESSLGSLSFIPGLLSNYFLGTGLNATQDGFQITNAENPKQARGNLFAGQGAQADPFDLISSLFSLSDPNINQGVQGAEGLLGLGQQFAGGAAQVGANAAGTLQEGLDTGFKPDLQPIIESRERDFFRNIVPGIQQQNVFANEGGAFGTDITSQLFDAGKDLSVELGGLETGLQNQAADRRSQLTGLSGSLLTQLQNLPFEGGFNALNLGEQLALQGTEGGRQATLLQLLTGLQPSGPVQGQTSSSKSKGGGVFSG